MSIPESEAKKRWDKENTTTVSLKLNHKTDADIIHKFEKVPNRQGYVKSAIRRDIAKEQKE